MSRVELLRLAKRGVDPAPDDSLTCGALDRGRGLCRAYHVRPAICRLWGVVRSLACPHGCVPERWLSDDEGYRFIRRAMALGR
jgi:Fe-S-cluster containining protein